MSGVRGRRRRETGIRSALRRSRIRPFVAPALAAAAVLVGVTAFAALPGVGSYALWNGAAAANGGSVTGGVVSVTQTLGPTFAFTFRSGQTTTTGGVLVTNPGTVTSALSSGVALGGGSSAALAAAIGITVWPVASVAACTAAATVPGGAYTATWANAVNPLTGILPPGGTSAFCIRSSMNVASAAGIASGSSAAPVITSTLTAGSWTSSAAVTATQTFVDDIAPAKPALTATTPTATSVALSFSATDNVGVAKYTISRDGVVVGTVAAPATTFTDTAVSPGNHTYTVTATDAAGNVSVASSGVTVNLPIVGTTWYEVVSVSTGKCVNVASAPSNGSPVGQAACAPASAAGGEAWNFPTAGSGPVASALPSATTSQYYWSAAAGGSVQLGKNAGQARSQWTPTALANGLFQFSSTGTGLCLDAAGGAQLTVTACPPILASQQFTLLAVTP